MENTMLRHASVLEGYAVFAGDDQIGTIGDFLFDDTNWQLRWLVVNTGEFLAGRKILLPPSAVVLPDPGKRRVLVELTMRQVRESPDAATDLPVSRQLERSIYDFYGWNPYWGRGAYASGSGFVRGAAQELPAPGSWRREEDIAAEKMNDDDPHLRSVAAVTGYLAPNRQSNRRDGWIGSSRYRSREGAKSPGL
jgi:hypothetical protein